MKNPTAALLTILSLNNFLTSLGDMFPPFLYSLASETNFLPRNSPTVSIQERFLQ